MQPQEWDAIVVDAVQANPALAARLALIEGHRLAGTYINTGCTPNKMLIASAGVLLASATCPLHDIDREQVSAHAPWRARMRTKLGAVSFCGFRMSDRGWPSPRCLFRRSLTHRAPPWR